MAIRAFLPSVHSDYEQEGDCEDESDRMTAFPRFTDLRAMAAEIADKPKYSRVQGAIEKAGRAQSCVSDLAEAETCCEALDEILRSIRRTGTITRLATEAALLRTAVTLYERATSAGAKKSERGSIAIAHLLTPEQRSDHDALVAVRQRSLAHVYVGEEIDGQIWHGDVLFAVEVGSAWQPAAASKRIQFSGSTLAQLKRQIPVALALLKDRFHLRLAELQALLDDNPLPIAVFERHQFDPVDVFGSAQATQKILAARSLGRGSFIA